MGRAFSLYAGFCPFCGILSHVFSLKDNPWLRLFRVPNLLTVPGDALVGAAFMMPEGGAMLPQAFAACVGVLFLYMYGLVDNDLANAAADAENALDRPIPRGEISRRAAMVAMFACLIAASLLPNWIVWHFRPGERLPLSWNVVMVLLVCCIYAYNRLKRAWLMGAWRGLSVVCGGLVAWIPDYHPYTYDMLPESRWLFISLIVLAMGWFAYIEAVTKLSEGEKCPSEGLGNRRYLLGLSAFLPLLGFVPITCASEVGFTSCVPLILPLTGCCCAFVAWCIAVAPLWLPHGPQERRRAVGQTIGALIYLQVGFMLIWPSRMPFLVAAAGLWLASRVVRRLFPHVSGS